MQRVGLALNTELLHFKAIGIITPILLGDVVAVFAFLACQGDLGTDIACLGHCSLTSMKHTFVCRFRVQVCCALTVSLVHIVPDAVNLVARAGLEPATQRL